ncbi:MAG TPA: hypothetical protein VGT02_11275 [Methylomirabilota bacterium]|jgi:hypothetical protein|nr:hypothetical protein [Methylomirabilota bacterium]
MARVQTVTRLARQARVEPGITAALAALLGRIAGEEALVGCSIGLYEASANRGL